MSHDGTPPNGDHAEDNADAYLIRQIRDGDQRAWRQLIDRYHGRLLAYARSRLGNAGDAEDALQEALMGFVTSLRHFDAERSLETYLFAILRYKIQELLTKRKRAPILGGGFDVDDEDAPLPVVPITEETPSGIAAQREQTREVERLMAGFLRRLIGELRDRNKLDDLQVVELLFFVGLRNKEAADRLERDEKGIAGVKFRALGRLKAFVDEAAQQQQIDPAKLQMEALFSDDATVAQIWRRYRVSCLKRSTIGNYLLGALDEPWQGYTQFHLDSIGCLMCRANLDDLSAAEGETLGKSDELFQSSVGFLSRYGESQA